MTLLVALKGRDGIVLASDSRGTFGDPRGVTAQNDSMQKAYILSRHVGALIAGGGELWGTIYTKVEEAIPKGQVDGATAVMGLAREIARDSYAAWFPHLKPQVMPGTQ